MTGPLFIAWVFFAAAGVCAAAALASRFIRRSKWKDLT